jgi:hypothetical protein
MLSQCLKKLEEFNKINLKTLASYEKFDKFQKIICNKEIIITTKNLLDSLNDYKKGLVNNMKQLISVYFFKFYLEDMGLTNNINNLDKKIINISNILINSFDNKNIPELWSNIQKYNIIFISWKKMDINRTIEGLITSYYNMSEHITIIKQKKNIEFQQQIDMIIELEKQRNNILTSIKLLDVTFDIDFLKSNYKMIFENIQETKKKLIVSLTNNMKKAYYDMISTDIKNGELMSTFNLLKDIGTRLAVLCPENKKGSFQNKFSDEILLNMIIDSNDYTVPIINFVIFMVDFIILMDAPINDNDNKTWKQEVLSLMTQRFDITFPQILIQIEEHIDNLIEKSLQKMNINENNN